MSNLLALGLEELDGGLAVSIDQNLILFRIVRDGQWWSTVLTENGSKALKILVGWPRPICRVTGNISSIGNNVIRAGGYARLWDRWSWAG